MERTGYAVTPDNRQRIARILGERALATENGDAAGYVRRLKASDARAAEWQHLLDALTMGESFFFRDEAHFRLLEETLLPTLIEHRKPTRELRIWSAGCSTGEEPYSVAILLHELLPDPDEWDVHIVGTDINERFLAKARSATYTPWSLRGVPSEARDKYFEHLEDKGRYRLRPRYRSKVTFRWHNLLTSRIPSFIEDLHDMDLILCRNVFIYFDEDVTASVAEKLSRTLAPGGYLLVGHAEIPGPGPGILKPHVLQGSLVFERPTFNVLEPPSETASPTSHPPPEAARVPETPEPPRHAGLEAAEAAFREADYDGAVQAAERRLGQAPEDTDALRLAAVAAANLGRHVQAARYCRRLLDRRPRDIEARYLLAKLAQDRGNDAEARELLHDLVHDAPTFVPAYLDLSWLHQRRGDAPRAREYRETALRLLRRLPPDTILSAYEGLTAGDVLDQLRPAAAREPTEVDS